MQFVCMHEVDLIRMHWCNYLWCTISNLSTAEASDGDFGNHGL